MSLQEEVFVLLPIRSVDLTVSASASCYGFLDWYGLERERGLLLNNRDIHRVYGMKSKRGQDGRVHISVR